MSNIYRSIYRNIDESNANLVPAKDNLLLKDINQLGTILSQAIRGESVSFYESVEKLRVLGREVSISSCFLFSATSFIFIVFAIEKRS